MLSPHDEAALTRRSRSLGVQNVTGISLYYLSRCAVNETRVISPSGMNLNTWEHKHLIFLFLWNFPTRHAFAIGASAQKLAVRRFDMLHWLGVGIITSGCFKGMCNDRLG